MHRRQEAHHLQVASIEISRCDTGAGFITADGSAIDELASLVSQPTSNPSLAQATVPGGGSTIEHHHIVAEEIYLFGVTPVVRSGWSDPR